MAGEKRRAHYYYCLRPLRNPGGRSGDFLAGGHRDYLVAVSTYGALQVISPCCDAAHCYPQLPAGSSRPEIPVAKPVAL